MNGLPKIKTFHDINQLITLLSKNGMEGFRPWRYDGYKWITFSDYKNLSDGTGTYAPANNLAYYISSDDVKFAQEVKLVLNINNREELQGAKDNFVRIALKTFGVLELNPPNNLLASVNFEDEFEYDEDEAYFSALKILRTKVFSWSLVIRSK